MAGRRKINTAYLSKTYGLGLKSTENLQRLRSSAQLTYLYSITDIDHHKYIARSFSVQKCLNIAAKPGLYRHRISLCQGEFSHVGA